MIRRNLAALASGVAFAAAAFAASPGFAAEGFEERVSLTVTAPFRILSSARVDGISDTLAGASPEILDRVATLSQEAGRLRELPGMSNLVTEELVEEAYAGGVRDAIRYRYEEADLEGMLDALDATTDFAERAEAVAATARSAGVKDRVAEDLGVLAIASGVHSAQRKDDRWIRALSDFVASRSWMLACATCDAPGVHAVEQAAFDAMLEVTFVVEEAILFSRNDREDIKRLQLGLITGTASPLDMD
jgi:hypothetical protein